MNKAKKTGPRLYRFPLVATRSGPLFNAHAYPTKIDPSAVALAIACHTEPGETIFDGFGGSGTTALGTLLCSNPSPELRQRAIDLGLKPKWGTRKAVMYEVSGLGSFIAETLCTRIDPVAFLAAAEAILAHASGNTDGYTASSIAPATRAKFGTQYGRTCFNAHHAAIQFHSGRAASHARPRKLRVSFVVGSVTAFRTSMRRRERSKSDLTICSDR